MTVTATLPTIDHPVDETVWADASAPARTPQGSSRWRMAAARAEAGETVAGALAVAVAAVGLGPLFQGWSWLFPVVLAVAVTSAGGALARLLRLPPPMIPVVSVVTLWWLLVMMFVPAATALGFLPGPQAFADLTALARAGVVEASTALAPAEVTQPLLVLAVGGAGLVALMVDTLWLAARLPALAAASVFSMYGATSVMLATPSPWWSFVAAAVGFLLVLAYDARGQVHALDPHGTRNPVGAAARSLGLVAVVVAVLGALVVPVRGVSPWHDVIAGDGDEALESSASATLLDPVASMRRSVIEASARPLLVYRSDARQPGYLRVVALERYDGQSWRARPGLTLVGLPLPGAIPPQSTRASRASTTDERPDRDGPWQPLVLAPENLDLEAGASTPADENASADDTNDVARVRLSVLDLANAYLPLPEGTVRVDGGRSMASDWQVDARTATAFSDEVAATGVTFTAQTVTTPVSTDVLQASVGVPSDMRPLLALPEAVPDSVAARARSVTAGSTTPYQRALALQRWFAREGGFTYSTDVASGVGADYLVQFLDERVGYCEQFAGAMAVMARTLGIPSRVVIGFTQGVRDADADSDRSWVVREKDAHAWPELWFDGAGWVRFEPTPAATQTSVSAPDYAPNASAGASADRASAERLSGAAQALLDEQVPSSGSAASASGLSWWPLALGAIAVTVLLALLPALGRVWVRRRRLRASDPRTLLDGAWREVADSAVDAGLVWHEHETTRQQAMRLARDLPDRAAAAVMRLQRSLATTRYARPGAAGSAQTRSDDQVRADVRVVRKGMRPGGWRGVGFYAWPSSWRLRQRSSMRSMNPFADRGP